MYSFGVLTLEVMKGKHPGESITSLTICAPGNMPPVKELLDDRLPYPIPEVENDLKHIIKIARSCLNSNCNYRPTMHMVSNMLSLGTGK